MYKIILTPQAEKDIAKHKRSGNKIVSKKIENLLLELLEHPQTGTGKPEQLKYDFSGYWSRRIDEKNRLIYTIEENIVTVTVVSAMGHYTDK